MRVNMVNVVRGFIIAKPELADSDVDLIYAIWAWQLQNNKPTQNIKQMNAKDLMKCWKDGKISSAFNISRSRRKCQQHYPETRGEAYEKKQKHQERIIKDVERETDVANRRATEGTSNTSSEST